MLINYKYTFTPFITLSLLYYFAVCLLPISILDEIGISKLTGFMAKYSTLVRATLAWADQGIINDRIPLIYSIACITPYMAQLLGVLSKIGCAVALDHKFIIHVNKYKVTLFAAIIYFVVIIFGAIIFMQYTLVESVFSVNTISFELLYNTCSTAVIANLILQICGFLSMSMMFSLFSSESNRPS